MIMLMIITTTYGRCNTDVIDASVYITYAASMMYACAQVCRYAGMNAVSYAHCLHVYMSCNSCSCFVDACVTCIYLTVFSLGLSFCS